MTPQTVNAVNLPIQNALNFPAAILQPPYFDPQATNANNYGAIGATIGHEISHSFDDQGSQFDARASSRTGGRPTTWRISRRRRSGLPRSTTPTSRCPDLNVNGQQTLSENIADVAGLAAAYDAYRASLGGKAAPGQARLHAATSSSSSASRQSWREKLREPLLRQLIIVDGHAPSEYRADAVRNIDAWYAAFDVKPGERLYLAARRSRAHLVTHAP